MIDPILLIFVYLIAGCGYSSVLPLWVYERSKGFVVFYGFSSIFLWPFFFLYQIFMLWRNSRK